MMLLYNPCIPQTTTTTDVSILTFTPTLLAFTSRPLLRRRNLVTLRASPPLLLGHPLVEVGLELGVEVRAVERHVLDDHQLGAVDGVGAEPAHRVCGSVGSRRVS